MFVVGIIVGGCGVFAVLLLWSLLVLSGDISREEELEAMGLVSKKPKIVRKTELEKAKDELTTRIDDRLEELS